MNIRSIVLTFILTAFALNYCSAQSFSQQELIHSVDALIQEASDKKLFSGIVVVAQAGKPRYSRIVGYADGTTKRLINEKTIFNIGSINKIFTTELVHQLVKEKKLSLAAPINHYMTLFGDGKDGQITIEQLLTMRSGLGDYLASPQIAQRELSGESLTIDKKIAFIKTQPLLFAPGVRQSYSNSGFVVLGAIIEKATGKSYEQNLQERIFIPLHLKRTVVSKRKILREPNRAFGTLLRYNGTSVSFDNPREASPEGGMYTCIGDLLHFAYLYQTSMLPSGHDYAPLPLAGGNQYWNAIIVPLRFDLTAIVMSNMGEIADEMGLRIAAISEKRSTSPLQANREIRFYQKLQQKGPEYLEKNFHEVAEDFGVPPDSRLLNFMGYEFLKGGDTMLAIDVFAVNTRLFPLDANAFDSLAEAYFKAGNKAMAVSCYEKALAINPTSNNAKGMLEKLKKGNL